MEPTSGPVAAACVAVFLAVHFRMMGPEIWRAFTEYLQMFQPKPQDSVEEVAMKKRIEEGLLEVRQKNYILSARLFVHLMAGTLLLLLKISVQTPIRENWLSLLLPSMVYLQHLLVGSGLLQPGRSQVRRYALMNYFEFAAILVLDRALQVPDSVITEKFVLANRFVLSMVFMDTQLTAGGQLLFFLGNVGLNWYSGGPSLGMNLFEELQLWSATVGLSAILEFLVCARLRAALDAAQHEALLGSVQRILRGVCDGAVLLDDEHRVQGTA
ncbi:Ion_trans domain-containing protein, partial [Durusdinium trenchii]